MNDDISQLKAINMPFNESVFITAPAGYGKTYVMTERIRFILSSGLLRPPQKILALTFSNAAANEMKDRVKNTIHDCYKYMDIMNYHTFAYKILKTYGNLIGLKRNFNIVNETEKGDFKNEFFNKLILSKKIDTDNIYEMNRHYNLWYNKNYLQNENHKTKYDKFFKDLYNEINEHFIDDVNLDFDNLLFKSIDLFSKCKKLRNHIFNKYLLILSDEFQDTNYVQYQLFKQISINSKSDKRNVFVLGDKKQAIMKFQGAKPENIDMLIKDFKCTELELEKNHRTDSEKIISISNLLRGKRSTIDDDISYNMYVNDTINQRNTKILQLINNLKKKGAMLHNICLLFPQKNLCNSLKKELSTKDIDFIDVNDFRFDSIYSNYSKIFDKINDQISKKITKKSVYNIVKRLIQTYYKENYSDNLILKTIEDFSKLFDIGDYNKMETWKCLQEFNNYLQMDVDWTTLIRSKIKNKVFISTIHGSKGLEFDYIILFGIQIYKLPYHTKCFPCNACNNKKKPDISEAEDLFYVAITRSKKDIDFFFSRQDERNRGRTNRKISCLVSPLLPYLKFIDFDDKIYSHKDKYIVDIVCNK